MAGQTLRFYQQPTIGSYKSLKSLKPLVISMPGSILLPGFWLYVWRVQTASGRILHYVGRTGDSSSANAAPPYRRLGQHLGMVKASNALRTHLSKQEIEPESCRIFEFIAYGPLFEKQLDMVAHKPVRDKVAALEKALADALTDAGYKVLNSVKCRKDLDPGLWRMVCRVFARHFPKIKRKKQ